MANAWLSGEARRVVARARVLAREKPGVQLFLHYRRGRLEVSSERELEGFSLATRLEMPLGKTDNALCEWMTWELRSVPCHP